MFEKLVKNAIVEYTLRDKTVGKDKVIGIDRDGTILFEELGYRYRSGQEFHDHLSKKDIISVDIIGGVPEKPEPTEIDLYKKALNFTLKTLKEYDVDVKAEVDAILSAKKVKKSQKSKDDNNENNSIKETGNSPKTGTAEK